MYLTDENFNSTAEARAVNLYNIIIRPFETVSLGNNEAILYSALGFCSPSADVVYTHTDERVSNTSHIQDYFSTSLTSKNKL